MKKLLAVIALLLAMVMLLSACGQKDEETASTSSSSSTAASSSANVAQPAGIDGTWITTEVKVADISVTGLSEEELKKQMEEANQQVASGLVTQTLVFANGNVTFTQKLDASVTGMSQATENVATGTYTLDGNKVTMKLESEGVTASDMVATLNGNQLEWEVSGVTMVFTRK